MKQKFIYTLSVATILMATACTDDLGVQDIPVGTEKGYTMRVEASMNPASRMAIENDGEEVNYYWTADDSFTVFDTRNNQETEFTINTETLGESSTKADFIGTPETAYVNGQKLYAIYNKKEKVQLDANGNVNFDLSNQNGQLNEEFQYMWGDATYKDGKPLEFVFRHLVTTLQVKIAVPDGVETLSNVTLYSQNLVSKATLVLNEAPYDTEKQFGVGDLVYSYEDNGSFEFGSITLDGEFTPVDGYVTLYIYTLSAMQYYKSTTWYNQDVRPFILFTDEDGIQHASTDYLDYKQMEVGAVYSLNIEKTLPLVDFENEDVAWGSVNEPYHIANADQLYSLMMRSYLRLQDRNTNSYYHRSYLLTDDIVLDNRSLWYPIFLDSSTFDGNGKTISGNMNIWVAATSDIGLFEKITWGTLKDLNFDADMTLTYHDGWSHYSSAGTLVGELWRSTMQHCFSSARLNAGNTFHGDLGGLIGNAGASMIELCGFEGEIISQNHHSSVGGLVGRNNSWSSDRHLNIKGCYSDGSITIGNRADRYGGIVGEFSDPQAVISYCWNNASFASVKYVETPAATLGGIVGACYSGGTPQIQNNYWSNAIEAWAGHDNGIVAVDCASFEGTMPTAPQLKELNAGIMASGLMFSEENGHLVKNDHTVVPPSDIENW